MESRALRDGYTRNGLITTAAALALAAAMIGLVLYIHASADVSMGTLTRDPLSGKPAYLGLLSQVGILAWAAGAAVSLAAASALRGTPRGRFLLGAGALSVVLCIDDAFLLHDEVLPLIGVPEGFIYVAYIGLIVVFLVTFRRHILQTQYAVLMLALAFLALSMVCDAWGLPWLDPYLLEDGAKFVGITLWTAYLCTDAESALRLAMRPEPNSASTSGRGMLMLPGEGAR